MDRLITEVSIAEASELKRARLDNGRDFNSPAEAYGVLAEEIYEAKTEAETIDTKWANIIKHLHNCDNESQRQAYTQIEKRAILTACEYIQVAAMCRKAIESPCLQDVWENENEV